MTTGSLQIMVTTSRDPSSRLTQFAKEFKLLIPNSIRVNRGAMVVSDLVTSCRGHDFTDIVLLHENRCDPVTYTAAIRVNLY
jgi:U3 small nucleolar ribonucleoprotein protein IMP4